ncbi:hypothetical protein [Verrucomicrobium sp. BvORR106]|uniref:hypothetical protein n=1 Tax=Verrucomicrobium sp. BvORR106 TaxID=1403819 RepID=UPI002240FF02|nr:hypothetical protein [Verrucomicrobium sp. BvORR106]
MRPSLHGLLSGVVALAAVSCAVPKPQLSLDTTNVVTVYEKTPDATLSHPKVQKVGKLDSRGVSHLRKFLAGAKTKRLGYVSSNRFVQVGDRRLGVVVWSDGRLLGLDFSGQDASLVPPTTTHSVLVNSDEVVSKHLLDAVKEAK